MALIIFVSYEQIILCTQFALLAKVLLLLIDLNVKKKKKQHNFWEKLKIFKNIGLIDTFVIFNTAFQS